METSISTRFARALAFLAIPLFSFAEDRTMMPHDHTTSTLSAGVWTPGPLESEIQVFSDFSKVSVAAFVISRYATSGVLIVVDGQPSAFHLTGVADKAILSGAAQIVFAKLSSSFQLSGTFTIEGRLAVDPSLLSLDELTATLSGMEADTSDPTSAIQSPTAGTGGRTDLGDPVTSGSTSIGTTPGESDEYVPPCGDLVPDPSGSSGLADGSGDGTDDKEWSASWEEAVDKDFESHSDTAKAWEVVAHYIVEILTEAGAEAAAVSVPLTSAALTEPAVGVSVPLLPAIPAAIGGAEGVVALVKTIEKIDNAIYPDETGIYLTRDPTKGESDSKDQDPTTAGTTGSEDCDNDGIPDDLGPEVAELMGNMMLEIFSSNNEMQLQGDSVYLQGDNYSPMIQYPSPIDDPRVPESGQEVVFPSDPCENPLADLEPEQCHHHRLSDAELQDLPWVMVKGVLLQIAISNPVPEGEEAPSSAPRYPVKPIGPIDTKTVGLFFLKPSK